MSDVQTPILTPNSTEADIKAFVAHNTRNRIQLLARCEKDNQFRNTTLELCKRDPVFWINNFCWTYNPKFPLGCSDVPFVMYPFQEFFIREWEKAITTQEDFVIEKSRDMGASWLMLMLFQWFWLFKPSTSFLIGSYKENKVDTGGVDIQTLFGKLRYNLSKLPVWMKPEAFKVNRIYSIHDKQLFMQNPDMGSSITGQGGTAKFGRGDRYLAILFDELAYWEDSREAWDGCQQTSNCRIALSTPNGETNMFYKVAHWPNIETVNYPDYREIAATKGLLSENVPF